MSLSRRQTLGLLGGGVLFAAGGFGYSVTRPFQTALRPWDVAGQYEDPRMRALSFAILAPNPHNRQPWKVDLNTPDEVTLFVDTERLLPHTDPFSRQITIGLGCFLEVMRMAAAQDGFDIDLTLFPDGFDDRNLDARPVARAVFRPGAGSPDPLFAHVMNRRSLKEPYDLGQPVSDAALATVTQAAILSGAAEGSNADEDIADLRDITLRALVIETETPHTYKESVDLFRIGRQEIDANPDGIDLGGPLFETLSRVGLMSRDVALDTGSQMYKGGIAYITNNAMTAMGYVWLRTKTNTRVDQINAGRDWVRMNLAATGIGLGMQPMSQPLQEYQEVAAEYVDVHERLAPAGETVQMLARVGYGVDVPPSPRWGLEAKIIS